MMHAISLPFHISLFINKKSPTQINGLGFEYRGVPDTFGNRRPPAAGYESDALVGSSLFEITDQQSILFIRILPQNISPNPAPASRTLQLFFSFQGSKSIGTFLHIH